MRYFRLITVALYTLILMMPSAARAAGGPLVQVTQVDNSKYPNVTVYISVKDAAGQAIIGLKQGEFSLTEDGTPVQIVDFRGGDRLVISTVLAVDCSGSMDGDKINGAKQAALTFVDLMRGQDQAAVIAFNERVAVAQPFTQGRAALKRAIGNLRANGNTAWRDALYTGVEILGSAEGRKSVILLTDGLDNSSRNSLDAVITFARRAGVPAYAIGLGGRGGLPFQSSQLDEASLKQVAQQTDGRYYYTPSADELKALYQSLAKGMQQEYALTYLSPRPTFDGTRRNIVVQVGGTSGGGVYLEKHLLNVRSDPLVGTVCLLPLLLALIVPAGWLSLQQRRATVAPLHASPQPPAWTPPPVVSPPIWTPPPPVAPRPDWTPPTPPAQSPVASVCVKCGGPLRAGRKFCAKCGAVQNAPSNVKPAVTDCPHCGNALNPGAKFCNRCGTKLT